MQEFIFVPPECFLYAKQWELKNDEKSKLLDSFLILAYGVIPMRFYKFDFNNVFLSSTFGKVFTATSKMSIVKKKSYLLDV